MSMRGEMSADGGEPPEARTRPAVPAVPSDAVPAPEPESLPAGPAPLDEELAPNVAMLSVKANARYGPRSFELHFHHRGEHHGATSDDDLDAQQAHEDLSLGRLNGAVDDEEWRRTHDWMMNWWGGLRTLHSWLGDLLQDENAQLVVFDVTGYEIPWELCFHQPPPGRSGPRGWLGELIPVTRWTSLLYEQAGGRYGAVAQERTGGLMMMEAEDLREGLDAFAKYEVRDREPTVDKLLRSLSDENAEHPPFSLLMIRCHGEYTADRLKLNGIALERLFEYDMSALRAAQAIVLLNACITGRTVMDSGHLGAPTRSFAQTFLTKGARGVIATGGDIGARHSHGFAVKLVQRAGKNPENLARFLHEHRRHYAKRVRFRPNEPDDRFPDAYKRFFWSFMYVYFGHPDTTLRLVRRDET
ncbi:CHAT domain-containing protein [Actinomadura sp. 6K520]|uniref:CHAT domain-containing protein n=1 Tax=Actinomadura sp. 6K520 TaxID=2530364 RepID=UPI00105260F4|nr:CHAT domain-containing protein [Actinomadura sp. 6K520]TDE26839.1 CHAT domain-containing protein [Actinomadura sp. 6K520]